MTDENSGHAPASKSAAARYGFAILSALAGFLTSFLLLDVAEAPIYAPLVGAVALTAWYGGMAPALLAVTIGWTLSLWLLVEPRGSLSGGDSDDLVRWAINLAVVGVIVLLIFFMRGARRRAAAAAAVAEATVRDIGSLQELTAALSAAVTPADVAHSLVTGLPIILGARGGSVGLLEGDELVIVDPRGGAFETHRPGLRLPVTARAPIARAITEGAPVIVRDRAAFEAEYPDGAALTPYAVAALAFPLRVAGETVGAISFLFDRASPMHEDAEAIAQISAELGGQALERARLYERERQSRLALDRILRVAPRFQADSVEEVGAAICQEARMTLGGDLAMLWRVQDDGLQLLRSDPVLEALPAGLEADLADFPGLRDTVGELQASFMPDVQEEARGAGLDRVRVLGIHSSLRAPITIGGQTELVLIVSWQTVVSEPDRSTVVVARRFADQAGLALEQLERRLAEAEGARRAEETRRLQEVTAALSLAATATDVSNTCLEHALAAVGADAGFIVLSRADEVAVELVASNGYSDEELESWRGFTLDVDLPFSRAIASGEPVWALAAEAMAEFGAGRDFGDAGWVALPLRTSAGVSGALHLSFRSARDLSEEDRQWLQNVVSQCAQALERSRLFDEEQRLRIRSERLQDMTAALSTALTRADVAQVAVDEIGSAVGASGVAFAVLVEDRHLVKTLAWRGYAEVSLEPWLEAPRDAATPGNRALRRRASAFFESVDAVREEFPELADDMIATGHVSFLFVPLVGGRRANGLVAVSWAEPYALSEEERRFVESLTAQAAQALDRATHFESEQTIAETLQRSVLPDSLPLVEGAQLAARYLPGTAELEVGGDWFDAMQLPDGRLGLVVGDVVGKGVQAAASMAQLRNALRAYSLDRMKPSSTVGRLNRLAEEVLDTSFATLVYVVVDPQTSVCRFTSAGHPPPLVAYADGRVEFLEVGRGLPLGAGPDTEYEQDVVEVPAGSVLLFYTDGLIERRYRPIDEGLEALRAAAAEAPRDPERLLEHILQRLVGADERADDIALLAVRLLPVAPHPLRLRVPSDTHSLELVRDALRTWLETAPLSRSDAQDLVLATWEACANAIEHALEPAGEHVTVQAGPDRIGRDDLRRGHRKLAPSGRPAGSRARPPASELHRFLRRHRARQAGNEGDVREGARELMDLSTSRRAGIRRSTTSKSTMTMSASTPPLMYISELLSLADSR